MRSGLGQYFRYVEIVSGKSPETYRAILEKHGIDAARFLMIGNSLRSDVLPVVNIGGRAVHIPYVTTWVHEHADPSPEESARYRQPLRVTNQTFQNPCVLALRL